MDAVPGTFRCGVCRVARWCDSLEGWMQIVDIPQYKVRYLRRTDPVVYVGQIVCPQCIAQGEEREALLQARITLEYLAGDDDQSSSTDRR